MKKIILSLFLVASLPFLTFSQTEREQKLSIRNSSPSNQPQTQQSKTYSSEFSQKSTIRQDNFQNNNPRTNQPIIYNDPWMWNRWNRWGAPIYGFSYYDPWIFYDYRGRRIPARTYYYEDGKRDTVFGKPTKFRFGLNYSLNNEAGGWLIIGDKNFFIFDFQSKINKDKSTFYSDPRVNFVQASQVWGDKRLEDIESSISIYAGFGTRMKNTGGFVALGWVDEESNYQFFDETYGLSDNGKYSFRDFSRDYFSMKFGIVHDFNKISLKGDFDPIRNNFTFGVGINF